MHAVVNNAVRQIMTNGTTRNTTRILPFRRSGGLIRKSKGFVPMSRTSRTSTSSSNSSTTSSSSITTTNTKVGTTKKSKDSLPNKNHPQDTLPNNNDRNEAPRWLQRIAPTKGGLDPPNNTETVVILLVALAGGYAWFIDEGSMFVKWRTNDGKDVGRS